MNIILSNKYRNYTHISYTFASAIFLYVRGLSCESKSRKMYSVIPTKLGVEVKGIDLKNEQTSDIKNQILRDVHKYKIMIFKNQGQISGKRQVEISKWFGKLESTFYKHPSSPHPDVFRVSNDEKEGCTGVGRTGWHIDGSFQPAPFAFSIYHIINVPERGATVFASLNQLIMELSEEKRQKWERLYMISDMRMNRVHPLIYSHPITQEKTLCFHLGMTEAFVWDYGTQESRVTDHDETVEILREIHHEFIRDDKTLQYVHKWQEGDFIISDNLAVGHEAHPDTQLPRSVVGLRIMHRTTIKGTTPPRKNYTLDNPRTVKEEL